MIMREQNPVDLNVALSYCLDHAHYLTPSRWAELMNIADRYPRWDEYDFAIILAAHYELRELEGQA